MIGSVELLFLVILLFLVYKMIKKYGCIGLYRVAYYICRRNVGPESPFSILILLMILKASFKKGLRKKTFRNISNWNLVYEIGNRYSCSFVLYNQDVSFTVIADANANLDFQDLDVEGLEKLDRMY